MEKFEFTAKEENEEERIDKFLPAHVQNISRSYIHKLIESKNVIVNEKSVNKNYKLAVGDKITITVPKPQSLDATPENIPLDIIYEDSDLLVVNKPKGMVVHPAAGNFEHTLVNALLYYCKGSLSGINGTVRPGIVHRIDKNTSGLLIVAKNDNAHKKLAEQIKSHSFTRKYEAIVYGNIKNDEGSICANIGRNKSDRKKMAVVTAGGKTATTHYKVLNRYENFTHIKLRLETGRTHQIRVHTAYIGHAVLGDDVYASAKSNPFKFLSGQCLHARTIGFIHPTTGEYMEFKSELPEYFLKVLSILKACKN